MSSWPELTEKEKSFLKKKMEGKNKEQIEKNLSTLDDQFWQALKDGQWEKADKLAKMFIEIQKY